MSFSAQTSSTCGYVCVCLWLSSPLPLSILSLQWTAFIQHVFISASLFFFSLFSPFLPLSISIYILLPLLVLKDISVIQASMYCCTGLSLQWQAWQCITVGVLVSLSCQLCPACLSAFLLMIEVASYHMVGLCFINWNVCKILTPVFVQPNRVYCASQRHVNNPKSALMS